MSLTTRLVAVVFFLLVPLAAPSALADDEIVDEGDSGASEEVTTRGKDSARKMRQRLKDAQKAASEAQGPELENLEVEASQKVDRALGSSKAAKRNKLADRENLVDEVQDAQIKAGLPPRLPRRRWNDPDATTPVDVDPGEFGGHYAQRARMAQGGQGTVDLLRSDTGQLLILKSTKADASQRPLERRKLAREAQMQNAVAGGGGGGYSAFLRARQISDNQLVMAYGGPRLTDGLKDLNKMLAADHAAVSKFLAREMLGAVAQMERAGIVHRDLKPDNLLIDPATGSLKIVDFGIAKRLTESDIDLNKDMGLTWGTGDYRPPESMAISSKASGISLPPDLAKMAEKPTSSKMDVFAIGRILGRDLKRADDDRPSSFDRNLDSFAKRLRAESPDARPSADAALNDAFLAITPEQEQRARGILLGLASKAERANTAVRQAKRLPPPALPRPQGPAPVPPPQAAPRPQGPAPVPPDPAAR